jgi:prenyltransferase beta subunit
MSLRLEMLQVARLAPRLLGDSTPLVRDFLLREQNPDGGFKDRSGASDLYYTVFCLDGLIAVTAGEVAAEAGLVRLSPRARAYLDSFGDGAGLDFVHLCCLARAWAALAQFDHTPPAFPPTKLLDRLEKFRTPDGGYNPAPGGAAGTAYGAFLALGAWQDLRMDIPEKTRLASSLEALRTADGAWTNELLPAARSRGSTNATAAVVSVLRNLGMPANPATGAWLVARAHSQGGFRATPDAPLPDLLSTATALHALAGLEISLDPPVQERCLDFVDSLWTNAGGFHGHWSDDALDSEYTFYGLLALGHLSLGDR